MKNQSKPLPISHFYIVVKPHIYNTICNSNFINKHFAFNHSRTTTNNTTTYSGFYIFGDSTYLEIFEEGNNPYAQPNHFGVAFGCDEVGEFEKLKNRLAAKNNLPFKTELMHKKIEGTSVPWFYMIDFDYKDLCPEMMSWFMEYRPDYGALDGDVSRKNYLDKNSRNKENKNTKYILQDFNQVTLTLTAPVAERFNTQLKATGHTSPSNIFSYKVGTTNHLDSLHFVTTREYPTPETVHFGDNCYLTLGPGHNGTWSF